ncbi:hypothetical protein [Scytonema sp. NUACC21]
MILHSVKESDILPTNKFHLPQVGWALPTTSPTPQLVGTAHYIPANEIRTVNSFP